MADWNVGDGLLDITEHKTLLAEVGLVDQFPAELWSVLGFGINRRLGGAEGLWEVTADRYVGVAQLRAGKERAQLRIHPKIDADIFFLADYAFGAQRDLLADRQLTAELGAVRPDPASCLLAWYLAELDAFVRRWLRRDYVLRREVFDGKVRGRLLVGDYVAQYLGRGQAHKAPCQLFDLTPNNLANQILKAALRRVARLSTRLPAPAAKRALLRRVDRLLPAFSGVADRTILSSDYNRLQLRGALRHYGPMIAKSRAMLDGFYLSEELGPHVQDAFLWDMSILFEEALRGVLASWPAGQLDRKRWSTYVVDPAGVRLSRSAVKPDYVMTTAAGRLVLDAKYKDVLRTGDDDDAGIEVARTHLRIGRADIYQAISYSRYERYAPAIPALVYPVSLQDGEALPAAHTVEGFQQDVLILFLDVGPHAKANLAAFFDHLHAAAGLPDEVAIRDVAA
jgi:5-methylcytosine-specific restriction enzyme subunit McrC